MGCLYSYFIQNNVCEICNCKLIDHVINNKLCISCYYFMSLNNSNEVITSQIVNKLTADEQSTSQYHWQLLAQSFSWVFS